ncbi:MAG: hypothetical protein BWY32_02925 [bacterium ADurb.Bin243]|nr:MAG: hypothetical protein BWY32_02925 [bacterium ADurb.Bin243]HOD39916.1 hypothetical protein [Candidatus Wallbacteria bacterium]
MTNSNLIIVSGHLGSGKTEFCLNYASHLKRNAPQSAVALCDLDFINPYFRSRKHKEYLNGLGVEVITPEDREISAADMPSVSGRIKSMVLDRDAKVILEVGGDGGAIVLGHLSEFIHKRGFSHYMVLNLNRPDTDTFEKITDMIALIEKSSKTSVTHLVLNNHLMQDTSAAVVREGYLKVSGMPLAATPVKYVCASGDLIEELKDIKLKENEEWFALKRVLRYAHEV